MKKIIRKYSAILFGFLTLISCNQKVENEGKNALIISKENEQSAIELGKWGMPLVSFFAQKEANLRDMEAGPNEILYWSEPFDHNNKFLTPNDVVLYISAYIETFDGPMVFEIPETEQNIGLFGSIVDPFMVPLEDIGGEKGIDKGLGGKVLITPPNYTDDIPDGYLHIPSAHFNSVAGLRITPKSFSKADIDEAIAFIKKMKLVLSALESSTSTNQSQAVPAPETVCYLTSSSLLSTQMAFM